LSVVSIELQEAIDAYADEDIVDFELQSELGPADLKNKMHIVFRWNAGWQVGKLTKAKLQGTSKMPERNCEVLFSDGKRDMFLDPDLSRDQADYADDELVSFWAVVDIKR
jgi:hypothetical protein